MLAERARPLPAPPAVVWRSLTHLQDPRTRPWLVLLPDEVRPQVVEAVEASYVCWSSLWPSRPDDVVHLELTARAGGTLLRFRLEASGALPDASRTGHLRRRLNQLLFADLRFSYGQ